MAITPRSTLAQAQLPEPEAKHKLTLDDIKAFCASAAAYTAADEAGNTPLHRMTTAERQALANELDAFRDRLEFPENPEHTRIASWVPNRRGQVKILNTAINTVRARISQLDPEVPARVKRLSDLSQVTRVFPALA